MVNEESKKVVEEISDDAHAKFTILSLLCYVIKNSPLYIKG